MSLRAIALHESISRERLAELFGPVENQVFSSANATACGHCGARFAIWYADRQDPDIRSHVRGLEIRIAEDCKDGKHPGREIRFETTP